MNWYVFERAGEIEAMRQKGGITLPFDGSLSAAERRMIEQKAITGPLKFFYSTTAPEPPQVRHITSARRRKAA